MTLRLRIVVGLMVGMAIARASAAQAGEGVMSDAEVESVRDANYVPAECIAAYEKILNTREKEIEELLAKPRHAGREQDLHDLMEQMAAIADELSDHLDEYGAKHRDIRKALPKLVLATERWATSLRAPADDATYKVVRKLALDAVQDMRDEAEKMETEQEAYFMAHPDAAKAEKERLSHLHDPTVPSEQP